MLTLNLVLVATIVDLAAWEWVINGEFMMKSNDKDYRFTKRFIKKQGLRIIGLSDKKFIYDPDNVFSWEVTRETPSSVFARALSRLPYQKRKFKDLYRDFDSSFFDHVTLILNISHKCTMSCVYCCAGGGSYGGIRELMPIETALKAVDLLSKATRLTVIFFGGEPMLNQSVLFAAAEYILKKANCNGIDVDFHLSTNGTVSFKKSPEICELVKANHFEVIVSIDGPAEVQDKNRPLKNNGPSFDMVYTNLQELIGLVGSEKVTAKVTMQRNADDILGLIEPMLQIDVTKILVTPIVNSSHYCRGKTNFTAADYRQMVKRDQRFLPWYANEINSKPALKIQPYHKLLSIL